MAVRTVNLYDSNTDVTFATIYFNSNTSCWYSDANCTEQISSVAIPLRAQFSFAGYRISNSSSATLYINSSGTIVYTPSWTSAGTTTLYARWTQISARWVINYSSTTITPVFPRSEWYRSTTASRRFFADSQLTQEITDTGIGVPYAAGYKFRGIFSTDGNGNIQSEWVDAAGKFILPSTWTTADRTNDWNVTPVMWSVCYYMNLNANGGTGGEANKVYYDRVNGKWCRDAYMLDRITAVTLPTYSGKIFKGYYTATSGGTQVIDAHGGFLSGAKLTSANKTFYAQWANPVKITLNANSGTGGTTSLWYGGGKWYDSSSLNNEVTAIVVPSRSNHTFLGYYSGSTQVIASDGTISSSYAPSAAVTISASWEQVSWTIGITLNGGGGTSAIYANYAKTAVYADEFCTGEAITGITRPTRAGHRFVGCYTTNDVSGLQLIDGTGAFTADMAAFVSGLSANATIYCIWQQVFTITLDSMGGGGAPSEIYYDDLYENFYDSESMSVAVQQITCPRLECFAFQGFYTAESGGAQRIAADGTFVAGWAPTADETLYAQWVRRCWRMSLEADGGTGGTGVIYNDGETAAWYADDELQSVITAVEPPTKPGYTFAGFVYDDSPFVAADGTIGTVSPLDDNASATAEWTANTYTLNFNYDGGIGTVQSKEVTFGQPIGTLPSATRTRAYFLGWLLEASRINASTVYDTPGNATATADWSLQFGGVTDYFALGNNGLVPISSDAGDNIPNQRVAHTGKYENGVNEFGGTWRNPTVTYLVCRNTTLSITLGKAYKGSGSISGYMITGVQIVTRIGKFPTVKVTATANEGADAINLFRLQISLQARARAFNLMSAVNGGGQLQELTLTAGCEPVVCAENLMPCASDIVHGKLTATATTFAPNNENPPTAGGGFALVGTPKQCGDKSYTAYQFTAEKEMA